MISFRKEGLTDRAKVEDHFFLITRDGVLEDVSTDKLCIIMVFLIAGPGSESPLS